MSPGSLAAITAPLLFTRLFAHFTHPAAAPCFPGAAYLGASAIRAATLAARLWLAPRN